jgi:thiol-disulfide isomerase/thioredoxin
MTGNQRVLAGATLLGAIAVALAGAAYVNERVPARPRITVTSVTATDDEPLSADTSQFSFWDQPRALPAIAFTDRAGHAMTLAAFRGRPILLNIWAPWCIPCRKEMPALDKLQAEIGTSALTVLPLSIDRRGLGVVEQFYRDQHLASLGVYLDQSGEAAGELDTAGVPMTLLIDRDGREVGRRLGALDWDSRQVVALIDRRLGLPARAAALAP